MPCASREPTRPAPATACHRALAAALALASSSCHWPGFGAAEPESPAVAETPAPDPDPADRRPRVAVPETYEMMDLLDDLRERVLELEIEVAEFNQGYTEIGFGNFLELDPWNLAADQVYFLKHFCDNGDFTLAKEAELLLLEREIARRRAVPEGATTGGGERRSTLQERIEAAITRAEQRVADLEKIANLFRTTTGNPIQYPSDVAPEILAAERRYVVERQTAIRGQLEELDAAISAMHATVARLPVP
jgi:hypothetical protein